jgi:hypothetical protein
MREEIIDQDSQISSVKISLKDFKTMIPDLSDLINLKETIEEMIDLTQRVDLIILIEMIDLVETIMTEEKVVLEIEVPQEEVALEVIVEEETSVEAEAAEAIEEDLIQKKMLPSIILIQNKRLKKLHKHS